MSATSTVLPFACSQVCDTYETADGVYVAQAVYDKRPEDLPGFPTHQDRRAGCRC